MRIATATFRKAGFVFRKPRYVFIAFLSALTILGLLLWLFSFDTLLYVLSLPNYAASEKINFFLSPYVNSFGFFFKDLVTATRLIFSVLAGIGFALYIYLRRHQPEGSLNKRKGIGSFSIALLGSGCVACGTSLISPVLIGTSAGVSAVIGAIVGSVGYLIGIGLMLFAIKSMTDKVVTSTD